MGLGLLAEGGEVTSASVTGASVTGADAVTILLDVATSFRRFDDLVADPVAEVAARLDQASAMTHAAHKGATSRPTRPCGRALRWTLAPPWPPISPPPGGSSALPRRLIPTWPRFTSTSPAI